jgi:hypothetical protein
VGDDAEYVDPQDMLVELKDDNLRLTSGMQQVHNTCDEYHDVATASLLENWIDETERRTWFLHEASHRPPGSIAEGSTRGGGAALVPDDSRDAVISTYVPGIRLLPNTDGRLSPRGRHAIRLPPN